MSPLPYEITKAPYKQKKGTTPLGPFPFQHYVREKISYSQGEVYEL